MRRLSAEERAVWGRVAGTVRPVVGRVVPAEPFILSEVEGLVRTKPKIVAPLTAPALGQVTRLRSGRTVASNNATQNTLDGSWDKRLRLGQAAPDFTIDLHGETLSSAHARLNRSLAAAIRSEARIILLITGRPAKDNPRLPPTSRGVIRATVGDWLAASPYASHIAAVRGAHPRHGGAGAMYLILRRAR
jgi:DNA-nicking Smr family endonuclease